MYSLRDKYKLAEPVYIEELSHQKIIQLGFYNYQNQFPIIYAITPNQTFCYSISGNVPNISGKRLIIRKPDGKIDLIVDASGPMLLTQQQKIYLIEDQDFQISPEPLDIGPALQIAGNLILAQGNSVYELARRTADDTFYLSGITIPEYYRDQRQIVTQLFGNQTYGFILANKQKAIRITGKLYQKLKEAGQITSDELNDDDVHIVTDRQNRQFLVDDYL